MCAQLVLLEHRVVDRQDRAARIAEDVLDALVEQGLDHHFGAGHFLGHGSLQSVCRFSASGNKKGPLKGPGTHRFGRRWLSATPGGARGNYDKNIAQHWP